MMLEMLHLDEADIAKVGAKAISQAHAAGVPAYYIDAARGDGIVKALPDGSVELIDPAVADEMPPRSR